MHGITKTNRPDPAVVQKQSHGKDRAAGTKDKFSRLLDESVSQAGKAAAGNIQGPQGSSLLIEPSSFLPQTSDETGFREILKVVMRHEGHSLIRKDGIRGASKMGILQSTAREYGYKGDIRNLTAGDAEGIYKKIWERSGASKLPYPLSLIHFDTYVNSPAAARKILARSGGDIDTYLSMRSQRYERLAKLRPEVYAKYLNGWKNRINHLSQVATEYAAKVRTLEQTARASRAVEGSEG